MKLKNKRTGAVGELRYTENLHVFDEDNNTYEYDSLQSLNDEWEDVHD